MKLLVPEIVWPKTVSIDGAEIKVRNAPYTFGIKRVLKRGDYEVDERKFLSDILKPGEVVVEMGGSIGIVTAVIAKKVGPSGYVISVEASQKLAQYSRTWLESGNNVKVLVGFGFPVWEVTHPIEIQKFEEKWGSMSGRLTFRAGPAPHIAGSNKARQVVYDLRTLSAFFPRPATTLVCDIEGSEQIISSQKPEFPQTLRNLLIELHPEIYGPEIKQEIIRRLEADGFRSVGHQNNVFWFTRSDTAGNGSRSA